MGRRWGRQRKVESKVLGYLMASPDQTIRAAALYQAAWPPFEVSVRQMLHMVESAEVQLQNEKGVDPKQLALITQVQGGYQFHAALRHVHALRDGALERELSQWLATLARDLSSGLLRLTPLAVSLGGSTTSTVAMTAEACTAANGQGQSDRQERHGRSRPGGPSF
jgi:hypothetical protein